MNKSRPYWAEPDSKVCFLEADTKFLLIKNKNGREQHFVIKEIGLNIIQNSKKNSKKMNTLMLSY